MKTLEEIEPILKSYLEESKEEHIDCIFDNKSTDYLLEQSTLFFSKFLKQFNNRFKYFFNEKEEDFESFVIDVLTDFLLRGFAIDTIQDRVFLLKNYKGLGSISIENQGMIASFYKKYPLLRIDGDLCWGYKRGGSVRRTAIILLNEVVYDYDERNEDHTEMAYTFADEVLSIFQQNEPARIEEKKIIEWIINYRKFHNKTDSSIIKKTCKELGLTYAQLAEQIGYSEPAIKKAIANDNVSEPMNKAISLYLRNLELEKQLEDYEAFKTLLRKAIN